VAGGRISSLCLETWMNQTCVLDDQCVLLTASAVESKWTSSSFHILMSPNANFTPVDSSKSVKCSQPSS
jgi:hypothetical protein